MCACSGNPVAVELISVYQNVAQIVVQTELQEAVTGRGMRPTVFVAVAHAQAARLGGFLKTAVMVCIAPAAILNAVLIVEVMHHLMKYHTRMIKEQLSIDFKFHYLRHTYGTFMADMNTPAHLLCNQMGHGNIQVTQKYYIAFSDEGINVLKKNLNQL